MYKDIHITIEKLITRGLTGQEREELLKYTYNVSLAYLSAKHESNKLIQANILSLKTLAIDTTAYLFSYDRNKKLRILSGLNGNLKRINTATEGDYFFCRTVKEAAEKVFRFEMLKRGIEGNHQYTNLINN